MTTANTSCPLALAPATIAAWRDGALSAEESARIAAHVAGCAACRREIALYESLDEALQRQPVPQSDGRLWRDVRAAMANNHRRHPPRTSRLTARRVLGVGSALAAVLLLSLGFARLFQLRGNVIARHPASTATVVHGTPTPLPTAAPASPAVAGTPLTTQAASLPTQGITFGETSADILTFGVAPTDGATAYACYSTTDSTGSLLRMYRTADRAAHWTQLTQMSVPHIQTSDCTVQVDALDPNRVLVSITAQNMQTLQTENWLELTENGGASWTRISSSYFIFDLATANGRTYAIRERSAGTPGAVNAPELVVSVDRLQSWRPISVGAGGASGTAGSHQQIMQFWVRPDGELLVEDAYTTPNGQGLPTITGRALWISDDGGAHWKTFPLPNLGSALKFKINTIAFGLWTVRQPVAANQPWHICGDEMTSDGKFTVGIVCTFDSGHTWTVRPYLCTNSPCGAGAPIGFVGFGETITADDSILIQAPDKNSYPGFYRLPAGSTQWQYLGRVPGSNAFFAVPSAGSDVIWLYAGGGSQASFSGIIGGHLGSLPSVLLETATYP